MYKKVLVWLSAFFILAGGTAQALTMVSISGNNVNMRSGPGEKFAVMWELGTGFPLKVLDEQSGWYKVEDFEGDVGWVFESLVNRDPHLIVKKKRVNMRSGPGDDYRVIGKAHYGVVFETLTVKEGWAKVKHENGLSGWVSRGLLWGW